MLLTVKHRTAYRYARPVALLPHRMMLRPRGQHDLRVLAAELTCDPPADIAWTQDVWGNLIATATFDRPVSMLTIDSCLLVNQLARRWPVFNIAPSAHSFPFVYSPDEKADLGTLCDPRPVDAASALLDWVEGFRSDAPSDTLTLLQRINSAIPTGFAYRAREAEGTQSPDETIRSGTGSCRDFATLFIESVRQLGFGARAVSGYLHLLGSGGDDGAAQHGATHAWAEVYLPCAGWISFDPTQGQMGGVDLIPVAVARNVEHIHPVAGSFAGAAADFLEMLVDVDVAAGDTAFGPASLARFD